MSSVITIENLGKRYRLGTARRDSYRTLRDVLVDKATAAKNQLQRLALGQAGTSIVKPTPEEFWALRNISLEVGEGEVVGIIGRNGAGKSTLLKVLSRITGPTEGKVVVTGRMASLLEVGTGFHPELTGRENVYMNGTILGMKRAEIHKKFDQIVEFSEVAQFIDTPVKRYSSGMYVRLAFAVAAHLDPDILVIDEVLSVGDIPFQKKCIGTMQDVAKGNRTVLFVTHNLTLVREFCTRAVMLEKGTMTLDSDVPTVLNAFTKKLLAPRNLANENLSNRRARENSGKVRFHQAITTDIHGQEKWNFKTGETIRILLDIEAFEQVNDLGFYVALKSPTTNEVITTATRVISHTPVAAGTRMTVQVILPDVFLRPGDVALTFCLNDAAFERQHDVIDENVNLPVISISSEEKIICMRKGYVSIPAEITTI